jgi:hypothetical protein
VEAASLPLPRPQLRARRAARRAARLISDAERFSRAADRLEAQVGADAWQVRHLRRSADDLRRLAAVEASAAA